MEKELREYIRHDRYPVLTGRFESKLAVETAMTTAPITEAEAQAYLGDLLLHSNRADGETYLKKALTLDPDLPMANASLAMLLLRQGKTDRSSQAVGACGCELAELSDSLLLRVRTQPAKQRRRRPNCFLALRQKPRRRCVRS